MLLQVQPAWQDGRTHLEILFIIEWVLIGNGLRFDWRILTPIEKWVEKN